ncbi:MAG: hypothetical protein IPG88_26405 [Gemmatimonadetes bacterium]|nr:hypothetical protein [Gemmatimonadota bacterium]
MRLSTATDDDLRAALTNMITISGDVAGSQRNLALAADLATFKHIGLEEAANVVGKAMNGNVTAFNKLGVAGKDATTVLENARASFGGFAEKEANTFSGSLVRIKNQWGELQEAVGSAILSNGEMQGGASRLADALANLSKRVEENETALGGIGAAIPAVLDGMLRMLGFIGELIIGWQTFRIQQSTQWQLMGVAFQSMIGSMKSAAGSFLSYLPGAIGKAGQALAASGAAMVKDAAEQKELIKKGEEILLVELVGIREEGNAALRAQIQRHHKDVESESTQHGGRMKKETEEQKKQRLQLAKEEAAERERILEGGSRQTGGRHEGAEPRHGGAGRYWQQVDREARKAKQTIELSAEEEEARRSDAGHR